MKKRDIILIAVLMMLSLVGLIAVYNDNGAGKAYIYVKGVLYGQYDLDDPQSIHIENDMGIINDIEIADGAVRMKRATCPLKECVKCGSISRNNESICCAPSQVLIIIRSEKDREYDAITK